MGGGGFGDEFALVGVHLGQALGVVREGEELFQLPGLQDGGDGHAGFGEEGQIAALAAGDGGQQGAHRSGESFGFGKAGEEAHHMDLLPGGELHAGQGQQAAAAGCGAEGGAERIRDPR
mgnify:CR=1 FL=1